MEKAETIKSILEHIDSVGYYIDKVITELRFRGKHHDSSKLKEPEIDIFARYIDKLKSCTYGSSEYFRQLKEMEEALTHHYKVNRHHPQHFAGGIKDMNLFDIQEMLCDWLASIKKHDNGDIDESIEINQKRFGYSDELKSIFKNTARVLK